MRLRLRYLSPLAQMALASWLLWRAKIWWDWVSRIHDMPGQAPTWLLALYINEPVFTLRITWFHVVIDYLWDCILLVSVIGLFWHWIALSIESWRDRRELFLFKSLPLRVSADLFMIALGIFLGLVNASNRSDGFLYSLTIRPWWTYVILFFMVFWPAALVLFPGYDLVRLIRRDYLEPRELSRTTVPPRPLAR